MLSRERVEKAINHEKPDRVPTFFRRYCPSPEYRLSEEKENFINNIVDVGPYVSFSSLKKNSSSCNSDNITYDELGIGIRKVGLYWERCFFPLAEIDDPREIDKYPWPDVTDKKRVAGLRDEAIKIINSNKILPAMGSWGGSTGIFEISWYMMGMEKFLMSCHDNVPLIEALLDKQLELHIGLWENILQEIGDIIDMACTGDDLGTQSNLLISPSMYRNLIKPRQRELIKRIKSLTDAKVYYHSCGAIEPLIQDLIDIGVDILDPVQPLALNTKDIKNKYGDDIVFYGGIDTQKVLPYGTKDEVRDEVLRRFEDMGINGGAILGPAHWIQPDVPWENIETMYTTIETECVY